MKWFTGLVTLVMTVVLLSNTASAGRPSWPLMEIIPGPPCPVLTLEIVTAAAP